MWHHTLYWPIRISCHWGVMKSVDKESLALPWWYSVYESQRSYLGFVSQNAFNWLSWTFQWNFFSTQIIHSRHNSIFWHGCILRQLDGHFEFVDKYHNYCNFLNINRYHFSLITVFMLTYYSKQSRNIIFQWDLHATGVLVLL